MFEGHFPGYPLMPAVLLIECMAQTTGWLVSALTGFTGLPVLAGVKEGKIRAAVFPGDELEFVTASTTERVVDRRARALMTPRTRVVWIDVHDSPDEIRRKVASCAASHFPVCDATLTYRIVPYPSPELRAGLWDWAERINFPAQEFVK